MSSRRSFLHRFIDSSQKEDTAT